MLDASTFLEPRTGDPDVYNLYVLPFAHWNRKVRDNFIVADPHDGPMPLDYNFFIIRNEYRTILVDTGFSPRAALERGRALVIDPIEALHRIGVPPDTIDDIVITHLHYDHAGNMDRFPKARFHIQDGEVAHATGRCMCDRFMRLPFDVEDVVTLIRHTYADRVTFHDGDSELRPGISLFVFPGHSVAVQGVRVMTPRGPVLLASDASHYFANVLRHSPFILSLDLAKTLQSYRRMLDLAGGVDRLIPGHDSKLRRLYPLCRVNNVDLYALHEVPAPITRAELERVDDFDSLVR
jgi:glyoxylase-like metal-dependent hydrolase (beta-lactamase superfamily II)